MPDKRFYHEAWDKDPYFIFIKQYYLTTAKWLKEIVSHIEGVDSETKTKLQFYVNQYIEAISQTNFLLQILKF